MDVHVTITLEGDVPVVVKSASGRAAERLRRERDRLEQARHPGVVALAIAGDATGSPEVHHDVPAGGEYELRTLYAGEPVSRWAGSPAAIAGVGAAVASTLADLHGVGIVHGRLDASHILIGDDGRPRLCGLSHPGGASPADDIAALGAVLDELVARARPDKRGRLRRARRTDSRALQQVIERATDPVATRRPSARNLADAILAAVPLAQLPTGDAGAVAGGASGAAASGQGSPQPDTLDRIWAFGDQRSDDERWAAAFGGAPPDRPLGGPAPPVPDLPLAAVRTPDWSAFAPDDPVTAVDQAVARPPAGIPFALRDEADAGLDDAPDGIAPETGRRRPGGAPGNARSDTPAEGTHLGGVRHPAAHDHTDTWAQLDGHASGDAHDAPPGRWSGGSLDDADLTRDHHPPATRVTASLDDADLTRDHHPPAARVTSSRDRRAAGHDRSGGDPGPGGTPRSRRLLVVAAGATFAGLGLAAGIMLTGSGDGEGSSPPDPATGASGEGCPPVVAPAADVDGNGCPEALVVEGTTVDAGIAQWSLGEPGDLVALGDWDCDGDASAALLRPGTGDVFVFAAWAPEDEPVTVAATRRVDGGVGLRAEAADGGCDRLVVDLAAGGTTPIEVPR